MKKESSGSENTASNILVIRWQQPARNKLIVTSMCKGVWGDPHTPYLRHQPRAARLAFR